MVMWTIDRIEVPIVEHGVTSADVIVQLFDKDNNIFHGRTENVVFADGKMDATDLLEKLDANFAPNDFGIV